MRGNSAVLLVLSHNYQLTLIIIIIYNARWLSFIGEGEGKPEDTLNRHLGEAQQSVEEVYECGISSVDRVNTSGRFCCE
jgi:hypothetical protein